MIARWWPLVYLLLAAQHCLSYNQQRHKSPFQGVLRFDTDPILSNNRALDSPLPFSIQARYSSCLS